MPHSVLFKTFMNEYGHEVGLSDIRILVFTWLNELDIMYLDLAFLGNKIERSEFLQNLAIAMELRSFASITISPSWIIRRPLFSMKSYVDEYRKEYVFLKWLKHRQIKIKPEKVIIKKENDESGNREIFDLMKNFDGKLVSTIYVHNDTILSLNDLAEIVVMKKLQFPKLENIDIHHTCYIDYDEETTVTFHLKDEPGFKKIQKDAKSDGVNVCVVSREGSDDEGEEEMHG